MVAIELISIIAAVILGFTGIYAGHYANNHPDKWWPPAAYATILCLIIDIYTLTTIASVAKINYPILLAVNIFTWFYAWALSSYHPTTKTQENEAK